MYPYLIFYIAQINIFAYKLSLLLVLVLLATQSLVKLTKCRIKLYNNYYCFHITQGNEKLTSPSQLHNK